MLVDSGANSPPAPRAQTADAVGQPCHMWRVAASSQPLQALSPQKARRSTSVQASVLGSQHPLWGCPGYCEGVGQPPCSPPTQCQEPSPMTSTDAPDITPCSLGAESPQMRHAEIKESTTPPPPAAGDPAFHDHVTSEVQTSHLQMGKLRGDPQRA